MQVIIVVALGTHCPDAAVIVCDYHIAYKVASSLLEQGWQWREVFPTAFTPKPIAEERFYVSDRTTLKKH